MSINLGSIKGEAGKNQQLSFTRSPLQSHLGSFIALASLFVRALHTFFAHSQPSHSSPSPIALKGCFFFKKRSLSCALLVLKSGLKKKTPTVSSSRAMRAFRHGEEGDIMTSATLCCHRGRSSQANPTDVNCRRDVDEGLF